eukprot:Awhi_evm1s4178
MSEKLSEKETMSLKDIDISNKDAIDVGEILTESSEEFSNVSTVQDHNQTKLNKKEKCSRYLMELPNRLSKVIPNEFKSWKRWLAFTLIITIIFAALPFIPTDPSHLISEDNPNPVINWYSLVPPVLTIAFAVCFQQVLWALLLGIFVGGMIHFEGNVYHVFVYLIFQEVWNAFNMHVILFTLTLVGMVYVMHRSGGLDGLIIHISKLAKTAYSTRIVTAFAGIVFFFDDYGNTVVVGSTFRGLTDSMQISREKLAYIVDSTAAPVAGVAIISTWIGAELTYFQDVSDSLGLNVSAYDMFLSCLSLRFYCYTALLMVFISQFLARDYGPMLAAEKRALLEGKVLADDAKVGKDLSVANMPPTNTPKRWEYAVVPLVIVLLGSLFGMFWDGREAVYEAGESLDIFNGEAWTLAIGSSDSAKVLFYAACAGTVVAILMPVYGQTITLDQSTRSFLSCIPSMWEAVLLLILAWGIKATCSYMETANFLVSILGDIPLNIIPLITFLMAACTALAIGSSWSTMGILLPIMMQLSWNLGTKDPSQDSGLDADSELIFWLTGAAVLDGAILGDHCSPISDTTVLSSVATQCDHMAHVYTQIPYALTGGALAALIGYFAVAFGMPFYIFYPVAIGSIAIIFIIFGAKLPSAMDIENDPVTATNIDNIVIKSPFGRL